MYCIKVTVGWEALFKVLHSANWANVMKENTAAATTTWIKKKTGLYRAQRIEGKERKKKHTINKTLYTTISEISAY